MLLPDINEITLVQLTEDLLFVQYERELTPFNVSEGLIVLPKAGRNRSAIALDVNVPPDAVAALHGALGPFSDYICTSGRPAHITRLYAWEEAGAVLHVPKPESEGVLDLKKAFKGFGFNERMKFSQFRKAMESLGYQPPKSVAPYRMGEIFKFDSLLVGTMPFKGSSPSHGGIMLVNERVFHIGTLGCDNGRPSGGGIGPVCGYRGCDVAKYGRDIDFLKTVFLEHADFLTGTGTSPAQRPDITPFEYMTVKLEGVGDLLRNAYTDVRKKEKSPKKQVNALLEQELLFSREHVPVEHRGLYESIEYWTIRNHLGL